MTKKDPIGGFREDLRAGIIAAELANTATRVIHSFAGKRINPRDLAKATDFIPKWGEESDREQGTRKPMTANEWQKVKQLALAYAGGIKARK